MERINYSLRIPEEHDSEFGIIPESSFVMSNNNHDSPYWPFLLYEKNRDLFRLLTLQQSDMVIFDGSRITVNEIQGKAGNYIYFHPRPRAQVKEIKSSEDLLLMAAHDICQEPFCFLHMFAWEDIGNLEILTKMRFELMSY